MSIGEERIESHVFKFIEKILFKYPAYRRLIDSWEKDRLSIIDEGGGHSTDLAGDRRPINKTSNPTEAKVMRLMMTASKVDTAKSYCLAVEDVMDLLSPEDKRLVELKYFSGVYTSIGVAEQLHISKSEFYRRRVAIIEMLGTRMGML